LKLDGVSFDDDGKCRYSFISWHVVNVSIEFLARGMNAVDCTVHLFVERAQ